MSFTEFVLALKQTTNSHCSTCQDVCCDAVKYSIFFRESELETFTNKGIRAYSLEELNLDSLFNWYEDRTRDVEDIKGNVVPKPALFDFDRFGWVLYAQKYCPHFTEERTCGIYEHPNRPRTCHIYPIHRMDEREDSTLEMRLDYRCPISQDEERVALLQEKAEISGNKLIIREKQ